MSADQKAAIERIRFELGEKFCHRCGYCQPCEQGVAITDILSFRSTAKRLPPNMAAMLSKKAMETVDNCSECGECVERCPYDLDIPLLIREVQQQYNEIGA